MAEALGFRGEAEGPVQVVSAICGVLVCESAAEPVAAGCAGVLENALHDRSGDAPAPVRVRDHDGFDEGRQAAADTRASGPPTITAAAQRDPPMARGFLGGAGSATSLRVVATVNCGELADARPR